jgi:hypothetical protein
MIVTIGAGLGPAPIYWLQPGWMSNFDRLSAQAKSYL